MPEDAAPAATDAAPDGNNEKPAILQESTFVVEEPILYKAFRTLSIWMNKLFFSSITLWAIWLIAAAAGNNVACVDTVVTDDATGQDSMGQQCSAFLHPTSLYLGGAAVISFILSIAFGAFGLLVGKRIFETTAAEDEVGARDDA